MAEQAASLMQTPLARPLVERFGMYRVWMAGLDVLGWPLSWTPGINNVTKVLERLEAEYPEVK